ncbi:MAG: hypothetical protein L6R42_009875, partial [Xanthoria sp. 1 TBL-2021]
GTTFIAPTLRRFIRSANSINQISNQPQSNISWILWTCSSSSVTSSLSENTMSPGQAVTIERAPPGIFSPPYTGQEAPKESKFCPLAAVSKWPYKFFHHLDSETISQAFFTAGKFRMRGWTL